ncbi:MAG: InlB B-repeat-containing protein [Fibromonadales bacterium]|nr:InlB B-repeat-containing protein [Fibromonadales bacterium]
MAFTAQVSKLLAAIAIVAQMAMAQTQGNPLPYISDNFSSTTTPPGWEENHGFYRTSGYLFNDFNINRLTGYVVTAYFNSGENPTLSFKYKVTQSNGTKAEVGAMRYQVDISTNGTSWSTVGSTSYNVSSDGYTTVNRTVTSSMYINKAVMVMISFQLDTTNAHYVYLDDFLMGTGYKVTFDAGEGSVTPAFGTTSVGGGVLTSPTSLPTPTRDDGYTSAGWFTAKTGGTAVTMNRTYSADETIYAQWKPTNYTITYNLNGGTNNAGNPTSYTIESEPITIDEPTRDGFIFTDWYSDKNLSILAETTISTGSKGNITLYAGWQAIPYAITYNLDEGENHASNPASYTAEKAVTLHEATKDGYGFGGWYDNFELTGTPVNSIPLGSIGNKEFWAKWIPAYTVTFDANGGIVTTETGTTDEQGKLKSLPTPTRAGYTSIGWWTEETGGDSVTINKTYSENATIYAQWKPIAYNLSYILNGGTNNVGNPASYTIESDTITIGEPTRDGYIFIGWYRNGALTNPYPEEVVIPTGSTGNMGFYASWQADPVPVIFKPAQALSAATPQYYSLKGILLGTQKPTIPGVYIVRIGIGQDLNNFQNKLEVVK